MGQHQSRVKLHAVVPLRLLPGLPIIVYSLLASRQVARPPGVKTPVSHVRAYTNATIGFTYPLPDGYLLNEDAAKQLDNHSRRVLFVADRAIPDRSCINRIIVMVDETPNYRPALPTMSFTAKLTASLTKNPDVKLIRGVYAARIAGKPAYRADFTKKLSCGLLHQSLLVLRIRGFEVCWMLGGFSQQERDQLIASLQSILF